jgi:CubicO group peptidase (beta-lactamase class C family)
MGSDLRTTTGGAGAAMLAGTEVPGATVALVVDGAETTVAVGCRDLERREPLGTDARFYHYSVTKVLLAATAPRSMLEMRLTMFRVATTRDGCRMGW